MKGEVQLQPPPVMQNPSDSDPLLLNQEEEEESPGSSGEIKDDEEDVEAGLLPCCRICLESDSDPGENSCKSFQIYAEFCHFRLELLICEIRHFPVNKIESS